MDVRRAVRYARMPSFWGGVGTGLRSSLGSADTKSRFKTAFRLSFFAYVVGSLMLLRGVEKIPSNINPLSTEESLGVAMLGGISAALLVALCRWLWLRWRRARAA
jgi:hypothetical protein